jgi:hypothetical protein
MKDRVRLALEPDRIEVHPDRPTARRDETEEEA